MTYYGISSTAWYIIDAQYISEWMNFMLTFTKPFSEMFIFLMAPLNEWEWIKWTGVRIGPPVSRAGVIEEHAGSHWHGLSLRVFQVGRWTCKMSVICRWMLLYLKKVFIFKSEHNCFAVLCFCCTPVGISSTYACIPSLLSLPPPSSHPSRSSPSWAPCAVQQLPAACLSYTRSCIYVSSTLSVCPTLFFPACAHKSVLYICVCIPALWIGSSVPVYIDAICIHALIRCTLLEL